ncbi:MAG: ABC transporter permease [Actinomycetia bacterium]|nr:ABC transporter permease [Actinomycetes bacterium]MCP4228152.1 ABC transporter permease [Actinomycetes bacterium]MCP5035656.1 ABC transporter permease [Actinomycetes bacterium]
MTDTLPSDKASGLRGALPLDAGEVGEGKDRLGPIGLFREMPWPVKLAALWLAFIVLGAIYAKIDDLLGQALPLQDPNHQPRFGSGVERTEGPSMDHWLGTDVLRRDVFARIVHGGWVSLIVATTAAAFGVVFGGLIGSFVGYVRGRTENVVMSGIDVILAFPPLILLLAMVSIWQVRNLFVISLVIGFLSIPAYTRVARANTLAVANREFVHAAEAIGTKKNSILFREVIPNVLPTLLAYALVQAAFVIVVEGTLSFLGLSVQLPTSTWGNMINEGRSEIKQTILVVLWPSLALTFTVLSLNQVGDWLQKRAAFRSSAL